MASHGRERIEDDDVAAPQPAEQALGPLQLGGGGDASGFVARLAMTEPVARRRTLHRLQAGAGNRAVGRMISSGRSVARTQSSRSFVVSRPFEVSLAMGPNRAVSAPAIRGASPGGGRPPRSKFWAKDLTEIHEQFHADDVKRLGPGAATSAVSWLSSQTASTVLGVQRSSTGCRHASCRRSRRGWASPPRCARAQAARAQRAADPRRWPAGPARLALPAGRLGGRAAARRRRSPRGAAATA